MATYSDGFLVQSNLAEFSSCLPPSCAFEIDERNSRWAPDGCTATNDELRITIRLKLDSEEKIQSWRAEYEKITKTRYINENSAQSNTKGFLWKLDLGVQIILLITGMYFLSVFSY